MNIKVQNEQNEVVSIEVVNESALNSSAILNIDITLNNQFKSTLDAVKFAIETVNSNKYLTKLQNEVKKSSKRNTIIISEYEQIKDTIFKSFENKTFDEVNELIEDELMLLQLKGKTQKVYNSFDFWLTHKDQKLQNYISNYNRLQKYIELSKRLE